MDSFCSRGYFDALKRGRPPENGLFPAFLLHIQARIDNDPWMLRCCFRPCQRAEKRRERGRSCGCYDVQRVCHFHVQRECHLSIIAGNGRKYWIFELSGCKMVAIISSLISCLFLSRFDLFCLVSSDIGHICGKIIVIILR